jgi:ribulose-5-phosphate 4-epimerase/fuculose-1-phosphate aldolase
MSDEAARTEICEVAHSLFARGLTHGRTGNISLRVGGSALITGTGTSFGTLRPEDLARVSLDDGAVEGIRPSKEWFLHALMYRARPETAAVIHTHSRHAVAVSCLVDVDPDDAIPALTPYFVMRVGRLPLLPYFAPGDPELAPAAQRVAETHSAMLLRYHGPIVAGTDLAGALDALEEIEQTAAIHLLTKGFATRPLDSDQREALS